MNTAVQLRPTGSPSAVLLAGTPREMRDGRLGPIALFDPGQLVAYHLRGRRRQRLFLFRTLAVDDRMAADVPGVYPRVQLLLDLHSGVAVRFAKAVFARVRGDGAEAIVLSDDFIARASVAFAGRLRALRALSALLPRPSEPPTPTDDRPSR
jgi:hypothetical protein